MSEEEAKLRDEILEFLKEQEDKTEGVWISGLEIIFKFDKRTKYLWDTLEEMELDKYLKQELIFKQGVKNQPHFQITPVGKRFIIFYGGYTQKYNAEISAKEEKELNRQVSLSVRNTNKFIRYTFWAIVAGAVFQCATFISGLVESERTLQQNTEFHQQQQSKSLPPPNINPRDSLQKFVPSK